jgi:ABC-2 type transport system ATP-binding protein
MRNVPLRDFMNASAAISVSRLVHRYGERLALAGLDLEIERGEIFALLGPNGGGKTTLFRLLSTLIPLQEGSIEVLGFDAARQTREVRERIGVVFQAASLDKKLTVAENLGHQGRLYGMSGELLRRRQDEMLSRLGLADRSRELVEALSGGMRRRVELAKGMLHAPQLLLLDEPSTGLDPGARSDLWDYLRKVRDEDLSAGSLVALNTPDALRASVGGDSLSIETDEPEALAAAIRQRFDYPAAVVDGSVRLERPDAPQLVARLVEAFPGEIQTITLGKPSLEDVFIARTGHRFWHEREEAAHG